MGKNNSEGGGIGSAERLHLLRKVLATSELTAEPRRTPTEAASSPRPGHVSEFSMTRSATSIESVPLGIIGFSVLFVLADHGEITEATATTSCFGSGRQGRVAVAVIDEVVKSLHSLTLWIGGMSRQTFCSKWFLGHRTH